MPRSERRKPKPDNVLKRKTLLLDTAELARLRILFGTADEAEAVRKLIHDFLTRFVPLSNEEE